MRSAWACGVSYDGSGFCGWQVQRGDRGTASTLKPSLQATVESSLSALACEAVSVRCAGRTDAGVHALNQVIAFSTGARRSTSAWVRGTNARLPASVAVRWAMPVPEDFDPRRHALERCYRYLLLDAPVRPALWRTRAGWTHRSLDAQRMAEAAVALVGTHDFSAFRAAQCQARTPVREVRAIDVRRLGDFIVVDLRANAFLHHMVRNIIGTLVMVGDGRRPVTWPGEVLATRDRSQAAPTFSAAGLYLSGVRYPDALGLPSLARDGGLETMA